MTRTLFLAMIFMFMVQGIKEMWTHDPKQLVFILVFILVLVLISELFNYFFGGDYE